MNEERSVWSPAGRTSLEPQPAARKMTKTQNNMTLLLLILDRKVKVVPKSLAEFLGEVAS